MALLFCDSFDHYATAQFTLKWSGVGVGAINTTGGRNGTGSLRMAFGNNASVAHKAFGASYGTLIAGFGVRHSSNVPFSSHVFSFRDNGTPQTTVQRDINNRLLVTRNGTVLAGPGATVLALNVFYYIELKVVFATGATGSFTLRVNGVNELTGATVQTAATANASANQIACHPYETGGAALDFDDFYLCDATGAQNNDFLGDVRVQAILPSAAGATTQWTPSAAVANYTTVDEATPNDDTDYNSSATLNQIDTYAYGDVTPTTGTVKGIQTNCYARKDDAGIRTIAPVIRHAAVDYVQANLPNLSTSYQYLPQVVELNPGTGVAFTIADVNAAEFGVKLIA